MRYYATASGPRVREAMRSGQLGHIATPASGHRLQAGVHWCADNGAFTGAYPGDDKYLAWLSARTAHVARCAFAAAPDVVADGAATLARSLPMLERIRALGYPAALVAQDGLEHLNVPWDAFDVLFLGASTAWKLGPAAAELAAQARRHGKPVHMGRVNSLRRLRHAVSIGCESVDGTFLAYGPDINLPKLLRWLRLADTQTPRPARRTASMTTDTTTDDSTIQPAGPGDTPAPGRRAVWTEAEIRALGAVTDLPTAASIFGIGRAQAYELAKNDDFPVPVIRVGARYRVAVAAILTVLLLPTDPVPANPVPPDPVPAGPAT